MKKIENRTPESLPKEKAPWMALAGLEGGTGRRQQDAANWKSRFS
jgi:hypothetical protein